MARLNTAERRRPETLVDPLAHVFEMPHEPRRVIRHPNARVMPAVPVYPPIIRPVPAAQPESFISRNLNFLLPSLVAAGMILMLIFGLLLGGIGAYFLLNSPKTSRDVMQPALPPDNSPSKPVRLGPGPDTQWFLKQGNQDLQDSRFGEAERNFREAVRLSPNNAVCLVHLAVSLFHQKKLIESKETFQKATQLTSEKYYLNYAYSYLGRIEWERHFYSDASYYFGRAVEMKSNDFCSMACQGFLLRLAGNEIEGATILRKVLEGSSDNHLKGIVRQVLDGAQPPMSATDAGLGPTQ